LAESTRLPTFIASSSRHDHERTATFPPNTSCQLAATVSRIESHTIIPASSSSPSNPERAR